MDKKSIALLVGATGQDSSYMAEFLLDKGYNVIGVKRRSSTNTLGRLINVLTRENFSVIEGDIVDPSSVNNIIREYQPQEIYNFASQSHVHTSFAQPLYTFQVNALGVMNVLEAVRNFSPHSKILQCSTSEMFGSNYDEYADGTKYQNEYTTFSPNSPYAVAKLAAHELVRLYRQAYGIFSCSSICFNHESSRRGEEFVTRKITQWIAQFKNEVDSHFASYIDPRVSVKPTNIYPHISSQLKLGNIDAVRDWSHAKDMVRGMWMMLQQDKPKDYVLCSGKGYSVREFLDCAFSYIGINDWTPYVVIDPSLYRLCEVEFLQGSYDLAKKELGWKPKISFEELVYEMVDSDIAKVKEL